ncbi:hypothetical protein [Actinomadura rudentiformis]|uniref:Uncharacterized protein n=1 Tax=Actinomadura rudentiformis TaxID=359158 RepID=A0A6H9YSA8_9ACTN|nr:hypothetical protein [Actinomadura rudentiformis]KAB2351062.1 hypothetical protein F8566_09020 [Actinomadura rudentiformis]
MPLKAYRVISAKMVDQLARQLDLAVDIETTVETELNGGITGIGSGRRKSTKRVNPSSLTDPRLVEQVVDGLRDNGQLKIYRPERLQDLKSRQSTFVHEIGIVGTPVFLPLKDGADAASGMDSLTVWVFEPVGPAGFIDSEPDGSWAWDWQGSYLFLIEEHITHPEGLYYLSGVSALRCLVEMAGYNTRLSCGRFGEDEFGRDNPAHPIDKLLSIGGVRGRPRPIEAVYRIAAMTDEQATIINGKKVRLNDILAYPLYIADC